jgi:hypothetical protein
MNKTTNKFSCEVREPALRIVLDHEAEYPSRWAAVSYIMARSAARQPRCMYGPVLKILFVAPINMTLETR